MCSTKERFCYVYYWKYMLWDKRFFHVAYLLAIIAWKDFFGIGTHEEKRNRKEWSSSLIPTEMLK